MARSMIRFQPFGRMIQWGMEISRRQIQRTTTTTTSHIGEISKNSCTRPARGFRRPRQTWLRLLSQTLTVTQRLLFTPHLIQPRSGFTWEGLVERILRVTRATLFIALSIAPLACARHAAETSDASVCTKDGQCGSGRFCDRGVCAQISADGVVSPYGWECEPPVTEPATDFGPPRIIDKCWGAYLCIEGRCKSCLVGSECTMAKECRAGGDRFLGKYCYAPDAAAPTTAGLDAMATSMVAPPDGGMGSVDPDAGSGSGD